MTLNVLPDRLPANLSLPVGVPYRRLVRTNRWHYAINGLEFLSAASGDNPIVRESVPVRKQQFDASNTPGEQTLDGWWLRGQLSFHGGAGEEYCDPVGYSGINIDSTPLTRFQKSRNVDPLSVRGKVTLLNQVTAHTELGSAIDVTSFNYGDGNGGVFGLLTDGRFFFNTYVAGNPVYMQSTSSWLPAGSTKPLKAVTCDGTRIYVANVEGVWSAPVPQSAGMSFIWTRQYTYTVPDNSAIAFGFVKARLMLALGPGVYELPPVTGNPSTGLPTAIYYPQDPNWQWTGFTEGGGAIYLVGHSGTKGAIYKLVLTADGSLPVLSGAAVAAQFPTGEVPYSAMAYLGSFMGIGTNKGVRIASIDTNGDLLYGPLLFNTTSPVYSWTARDRFLFCAVTGYVDGDSGVCRIDLSNQIDDLVFAYCTDINTTGDASICRVVAHLGDSDLKMFGTAQALYGETRTLVVSGYLLTSRVRFTTLEPKLFKKVMVRGPALKGGLSFQIYDDGDHPAGSYTYPEGVSPGDVDASISQPQTRQDFISIKFTLRSDETGGAEIWGYQLKALPGVTRQRMIQLPLFCFDWERDPKGNRRGGEGTAYSRLVALEALETVGDSVTVQDYSNRTSTQCVIEQISFRQTSPPPTMDGFGGIIQLTLRTI